MIYVLSVIVFMVVAPIASAVVELILTGNADLLEVVGKWFIFWGVGARLLTAGASQTFRPSFTAQSILGAPDDRAAQVVRELGFANLGMGVTGIIAPWLPGWMPAIALVASVFLGLDGILHLLKRAKNGKEWLATVTDLLVVAALVAYLVSRLFA